MVSPKGKYARERKFDSLPIGASYESRNRKEGILRRIRHYWWLFAFLSAFFLFLRVTYSHFSSQFTVASFIKFNTYRLGSREFTAVGLAPLDHHWRTKYHHCHWVPGTEHVKPIVGRLQAHFPGEHHDLKYEAVILNCLLRHETPAEVGGKLFFTIDHKKVEIYREKPDAFALSLDPKPPFKHHVVYCSPPIHSLVHPKRLYEWLEYHFHLGVDYAIIYDAGGINEEVLETLLPYERQGLMEVRDVTSLLQYETWLYSQVMLINDCAYSTRYTARWTIFLDLDEFFNADNPPPPEVKKAAIELKQQELKAQAHWHRQLARMHKRHHQEQIAESAGAGADASRAEIPHEKRILLGDLQRSGGRSEEERERVLGAQKQQQKRYLGLKLRRGGAEQKVLSVAERKEAMAATAREQHRQMELLAQHREHLQRHKEKEKLLPLILDSYEGSAFLTFGSLWWDTERCVYEVEAKGSWAIQRMLYHWPHVYCTKLESFPRAESCLDYHGHRKYAVDPRKVVALQIHQPVLNESQGVDLDTTVAKINHFQGLLSAKAETCKQVVGISDEIVWWARGEELSHVAVEAQRQPTARFAGFQFPAD